MAACHREARSNEASFRRSPFAVAATEQGRRRQAISLIEIATPADKRARDDTIGYDHHERTFVLNYKLNKLTPS